MSRKVQESGTSRSTGEVIFPVPGNSLDLEAFDICTFGFSIVIYHMISGPFVSPVPNISMHDVFAHEYLFSYAADLELAIFTKRYHVIDVRTFPDEFSFFKTPTDKALLVLDE